MLDRLNFVLDMPIADEISPEAIGRRLKALRLGHGLTQQAMTQRLGYSSPRGQTWNNFETARTVLTRDAFERLRVEFGVPYTWLYLGETRDLVGPLRRAVLRGIRAVEEEELTGRRTRFT